MKRLVTLLGLLALSATLGSAQQIEVSPKRKPHTEYATVGYEPTPAEKTFEARKPDAGAAPAFGGGKPGTLKGYKGKLVSWFGIVRELPAGKDGTFLIEHKYYDGLNDSHMQLASIYGAGDFRVTAADPKAEVKRLCLVRIIGTVTDEKDGVPTVKAEYIRVWNPGDFAFMDYGKDASNERWKKLRKRKGEDSYDPEPDAKYYEELLGK